MFVLIATAGMYFLLQVNFLAGVQLMLYAGGITVLIIFSILLTSNIDHKFESLGTKKKLSSCFLSMVGATLCVMTIINHNFVPSTQAAIEPHIRTFGLQMLNYGDNGYVLPFEVITVLLLASMVAAIMIAKKK